jgi:hypothetical protein
MSTKSATTTPGIKATKVENTMPAPTAAATLNGENDVSTPKKSTKVCELHKDVSVWRAELLTQTFIGCWRCAMDQVNLRRVRLHAAKLRSFMKMCLIGGTGKHLVKRLN